MHITCLFFILLSHTFYKKAIRIEKIYKNFFKIIDSEIYLCYNTRKLTVLT